MNWLLRIYLQLDVNVNKTWKLLFEQLFNQNFYSMLNYGILERTVNNYMSMELTRVGAEQFLHVENKKG